MPTNRRVLLSGLACAAALQGLPGAAWAAKRARVEPDPFLDQGLDAVQDPSDPWGGGPIPEPLPDLTAPFEPDPRVMYAAIDDVFPVPAVRVATLSPRLYRQVVSYGSGEAAGTIVVDPSAHFLYLALGDGTAIRYGVGVGRSGFGWSGDAVIRFKRAWPDWYPPPEMLDRQPELAAKMQTLQSGIGMPGGPGNPLGARALYLWQGNKDTLFRIHGTVEPWTIGRSVSSGCIRMINQDVIDLFGRVGVGARVVVLAAGGARVSRQPGSG